MLIKHFELHIIVIKYSSSAWDVLLDTSIKLNNEFSLKGNVET